MVRDSETGNCAVQSANPTSAFGDLPAAPRSLTASTSVSLTNRQPWLNCASLSPAPALCFTISAPSALNISSV